MVFPILGELKRGAVQRQMVKLPGAALAGEEWPVTSVCGAKDGPTLFVNAGVHGGEYPAIEAVIRLGKTLDPAQISGTVVLLPVLNLPAFRQRTMFVCPVDGVNPNRVFPGDANGSYSEQLTHALINGFVAQADTHIDLHGGDIPESLVPFVICRSDAGQADGAAAAIDAKAKAMALAFGLPYVLTVSKPVQPAKGLSSYAAAAAAGVPSILAEAGGVGLLQEEAVQLLVNGVQRVMQKLGMIDVLEQKSEARDAKSETADSKLAALPKVLTGFEWVYAKDGGMWYSRVAAGDKVKKGQEIGTMGNLFGEVTETIMSAVDGVVLFLTSNPSVQEKGLLMGIGTD